MLQKSCVLFCFFLTKQKAKQYCRRMKQWRNSVRKCGRIWERLLVTGAEKWPLRTNTGDNCLIQVDLYIRLKWLIYLWKSTYLRKVLICSSSAQRFFSGMSVLASKPGSLTIQKNWAVLPTQNLTFAFIYRLLTKIHRTKEKNLKQNKEIQARPVESIDLFKRKWG